MWEFLADVRKVGSNRLDVANPISVKKEINEDQEVPINHFDLVRPRQTEDEFFRPKVPMAKTAFNQSTMNKSPKRLGLRAPREASKELYTYRKSRQSTQKEPPPQRSMNSTRTTKARIRRAKGSK